MNVEVNPHDGGFAQWDDVVKGTMPAIGASACVEGVEAPHAFWAEVARTGWAEESQSTWVEGACHNPEADFAHGAGCRHQVAIRGTGGRPC